jgi:hypothetical protein
VGAARIAAAGHIVVVVAALDCILVADPVFDLPFHYTVAAVAAVAGSSSGHKTWLPVSILKRLY